MSNYTTNNEIWEETFQTKRNILNFSKKMSNGLSKPISKFISDIEYGMLASKNCFLTEIARSLKEKIKLSYTVERLSDNLIKLDNDDRNKIANNYY